MSTASVAINDDGVGSLEVFDAFLRPAVLDDIDVIIRKDVRQRMGQQQTTRVMFVRSVTVTSVTG